MNHGNDCECPGNGCLVNWIQWITQGGGLKAGSEQKPNVQQGFLFQGTSYDDLAPAIRELSEFQSAVETVAYALFRLQNNRLTRAERPRLENLVDNALFKMNRFWNHHSELLAEDVAQEFHSLKAQVEESRRQADLRRKTAYGIKQKIEQLESLSPEAFEEFVGEIFEALGYEVEHVGGPGDNGADLLLKRGPARSVVQCKYYRKGVIGSPDLQKFLGTIHQTESQKGFFVTTSTFSLSAEKFAANQAIELLDGPRLAELVRELISLDRKAVDTEELPFF